MKKINHIIFSIVLVFILVWLVPVAGAQEVLKYCSSAQVYDVINQECIDAFSKITGIKVQPHVTSSRAAVSRLMHNFGSLASTVEPLDYMHEDYGYVQMAYCKVPLLVIVNGSVSVNNVTEKQLREIFSGQLTNWKELGGDNEPIRVIVPGKNTGAYQNFKLLALKRNEINYQFMTYTSTAVCELIQYVPGSISFIGQGMSTNKQNIKALSINGRSYADKSYPYQQTVYFVTKGNPEGADARFIEFIKSKACKDILKQNHITPNYF